ncbi:MAG: MFS transporter [Lachnospiraceae bacterium]
MVEKNKISALNTAAIFALFLVSMGFTVVTPAMAVLMEHFGPNAVLISTLPTLFIVIGSFIAGAVMGKKMKYKTLAVLASLLCLVGGCAPALFDSLIGTLVCRALFGLGMGLMSPMGNALIIGMYKGQKQASMLGYGTLFMNGGGIFLQMLGGALASNSWQLTFWGHALFVISLVFALFLPEPEMPAVQAGEKPTKEKLGKLIWLIAILFLTYNMLNYPIMLNISTLFTIRNAGGPTVAATGLSLFTVAGCVAGFLFGMIFKVAKRWCGTLGYALSGLGALLVVTGQTALVMTLGLILVGFGFSVVMPTFFSWAGLVTPPATVAFAISLLMAFNNVGGFLSTFWLKFLTLVAGENIISAIWVEVVVFLAIAVIFIFYNPFKEKKSA